MNTNPAYIERRKKELRYGTQKAYDDLVAGRITTKRFDAIMDKAEIEIKQLNVAERTRAKALSFAGSADQYQGPMPGFGAPTPQVEGQYQRMARRKWCAPSPLLLSGEQLQQLHAAGKSAASWRVRADVPGVDLTQVRGDSYQFDAKDMFHSPQISTKDMADASGMGLKWSTPDSAAEGSPGSILPPELLSTAFPLRIEPVRVFELFPGAAAGGQAVTWLQHTSNSASAAAVGELEQKPDIGPVVTPSTVGFTTIAGMLSVSRQFFDDFPTWAEFAPAELFRAVVQAENDEIISGSGDSPHMTGLLNTENTLTRDAVLSTNPPITEIDVLRSAVMDLRQGPAKCVADLILLNVQDWDYIQKLKNSLGSYILDATTPNTIGFVDNIMGTRVVATTSIPQSQAIVMDTRIAVLAWTRLGMEILANQFDTYSWQNNAWSFRAEERIAIGVQYPKAINLVYGLNPQQGS